MLMSCDSETLPLQAGLFLFLKASHVIISPVTTVQSRVCYCNYYPWQLINN